MLRLWSGNVGDPMRSAEIAAGARRRVFLALLAALCLPGIAPAQPDETDFRIVAFGDSLTAGFGLSKSDAFPAKLEAALRARGHKLTVIDAGVSGDTASGGQARLDWVVPDDAHAVILQLGANDALRGIDPAVTRTALDAIIRRLKKRDTEVLLTGMRAPRNLGADFVQSYDRIYPELAAEHGVLLYPFFLEGVATDPALNQQDGIHPNAAGVDAIVERILPAVEQLIARIRASGRGK
jgi:acyl-CoA thioesterase-1